jgi:hypothetical protein
LLYWVGQWRFGDLLHTGGVFGYRLGIPSVANLEFIGDVEVLPLSFYTLGWDARGRIGYGNILTEGIDNSLGIGFRSYVLRKHNVHGFLVSLLQSCDGL